MTGKKKQYILFAAACLTGFTCAMLLREFYGEAFYAFYQSGKTTGITSGTLWPVVLCTRGRLFLLLLAAMFTRWFRPVLYFCIVWKGWIGGVLLGANTAVFGLLGIWQTILLGFPHMIVYVILWILLLRAAGTAEKKKSRITAMIPLVFLLLAVFLAGTFLEAYVNPVLFYTFSAMV